LNRREREEVRKLSHLADEEEGPALARPPCYSRPVIDGLYLLFFAAFTAFMATRVYLLLANGELKVKNVVYSRTRTPVGYRVVLLGAIVGTGFGLVMVAAGVFTIARGP
jgi:hypothetical protein